MIINYIEKKEKQVNTNHFTFKANGAETLYTAIVPQTHRGNLDGVLVTWKDTLGKMDNVWYEKESVERFVKNGNWVIVDILD